MVLPYFFERKVLMVPNIHILEKTVSAYMIVAVIGVLTLLFSMKHIAKKNGMDDFNVQNVILVSFIGVVIGSHLFSGIGKIYLMIQNHVEIVSFKDFIQKMIYAFGGAVFYGGLIGALIASFIYIRIKKLDLKLYTDIGAMSIPLFHCFGRIGCFLSGCCYGIESNIGFVYHYSAVEAANGVRRFPVQLAEAAFNLCLYFVIYKLFKTKKYTGKLMYVYLIAYAIARFILEFFRGDEYRGYIGVLSVSQFISVLIVITVTGFIIFQKIKLSKRKQLKNEI